MQTVIYSCCLFVASTGLTVIVPTDGVLVTTASQMSTLWGRRAYLTNSIYRSLFKLFREAAISRRNRQPFKQINESIHCSFWRLVVDSTQHGPDIWEHIKATWSQVRSARWMNDFLRMFSSHKMNQTLTCVDIHITSGWTTGFLSYITQIAPFFTTIA